MHHFTTVAAADGGHCRAAALPPLTAYEDPSHDGGAGACDHHQLHVPHDAAYRYYSNYCQDSQLDFCCSRLLLMVGVPARGPSAGQLPAPLASADDCDGPCGGDLVKCLASSHHPRQQILYLLLVTWQVTWQMLAATWLAPELGWARDCRDRLEWPAVAGNCKALGGVAAAGGGSADAVAACAAAYHYAGGNDCCHGGGGCHGHDDLQTAAHHGVSALQTTTAVC